MGKLKKYFMSLMLLGILLLAVGCTNSDASGEENEVQNTSKQNLQTVLKNVFTGPTEEQEEMLYSVDDMEKKSEMLSEYHQENFKPYLSERFYEDFVRTNGAFMTVGFAPPDYVFKVKDIKIEEGKSYYEFNVNVSYTNKQSDESEILNVKGHAQTNEEGKVTSIKYINPEDIYTALGK
ncbi:hypothetical protein [Pseudalkalibacillus caeni]|uniref:Lipoprotein n=1 Tax=Exobacillus caeni TaxID=2574798 RepID=A0A5R9F9U1_9BACL|nr:hypothetical protein [Pseudalkalibacillus caeni]TLS39279.1 hypothetical protein FCL54_02950 [Pseudalkalibacillus caeni]